MNNDDLERELRSLRNWSLWAMGLSILAVILRFIEYYL
jgi:hypothetical protein